MAAEAAKVAPNGSTIFDCAKLMAEMVEMLRPFGISPMDAVKSVAEHNKATGTAEIFRERYHRFRGANESEWSDRYANDFQKLPRWVGEDFMATPCAAINPAVIEAALRANGADAPKTVRSRKSYVLAALIAKPKPEKRGAIRIMTPAECGKMLRACRDRAEVHAVALLLFAGIRPDAENGEITRLDWQDVDAGHIVIHPDTSKTDTDRIIPITPRLARLLRGHPADGPVLPAGWSKRIQTIRKAAGVAGAQDITRHTFASNFLVEFGEDAAKSAMGHTAGSQTIFRHYRRAVKPDAAKKYFR
jgi:integrase